MCLLPLALQISLVAKPAWNLKGDSDLLAIHPGISDRQAVVSAVDKELRFPGWAWRPPVPFASPGAIPVPPTPPPGAAAAAVDARPTCSAQNQADGEPNFSCPFALAEARRLRLDKGTRGRWALVQAVAAYREELAAAASQLGIGGFMREGDDGSGPAKRWRLARQATGRAQRAEDTCILTNFLKSMGCCGSSTVDAEEHLDYSGGNVTLVTDQKNWDNTMEEVAEHGKTVVLKFSAIWCTPCRNAAPLFAELSLKYPDIVFVSVDVDEMPELVTQYDVRATPTFIFMKNNEEIDKLVGGNHEDLQEKFEQLNRPKLYDDV
uniref:Thioredoxin domain-containing protein n=1 Tax=Oryza rufipogon TaxID=4529 RepID=A0A0E0PP10_ORYRU